MRILPLLAAALLAACNQLTVLVTGDAAAVDARVLVDGKEIGRLEKRTEGERVFAGASLKAPKGEHRFEFVAPDGRKVAGKVDVKGDVYLRVDMAAGKLLGAE